MQLNNQLSHTSANFFKDSDDTRLPNAEQVNRRFIENRRSITEGILVERSNFHVRVADTQDRQTQVSALIRKMYSWRGYRLDTVEPRNCTNQTTLQACRGNDTLGTLTLNIDSEAGLLANDLYRREVDALRKRGRTVCELTGLAVRTCFASDELLATLFHLLHILGCRLHHATDAVIEINPRHSLYYQRLLGFRQIGERRICDRVDAPAVLLHIETDFVEEQIARYAGCLKNKARSLYPYFFSSLETERLCQRMMEMSHLLPASYKIAS